MPRRKSDKNKGKLVQSQTVNESNIMITPDSQIAPNPFIWTETFEEVLEKYSLEIPKNFDVLANSLNSLGNSQIQQESLTFQNLINFNLYNLGQLFSFAKREISTMQKDNSNLRQLNADLIKRVQTSKLLNKNVLEKNTQTENMKSAITLNIPDSLNESKLTYSTPVSHSKLIKFNQELDTSTSVGFNTLNSSNSYNSSDSYNSSSSKFLKIIIYNLTEDLGLPEIMQSLSEITKEPYPQIYFVKKYKSSHSHSYNYIIKTPRHLAISVLKLNSISIKGNFFNIKEFFEVHRCFNCQQLNHHAVSCKNPIACHRCGGSHKSKSCENNPNCINCNKYNVIYNKNFNTHHPSYASDCPSRKYFINITRNSLDTSM